MKRLRLLLVFLAARAYPHRFRIFGALAWSILFGAAVCVSWPAALLAMAAELLRAWIVRHPTGWARFVSRGTKGNDP